MRRYRSLLVALCLFTLLAAGGTVVGATASAGSSGSALTSAEKATLKAPKTVSIGRKLVLRVSGFPPRTKVFFSASIYGPAAYSGRSLGRVRTNEAGRATLRKRFPRTYQWCDADRKCSTYKWMKGMKVALTAATRDGSAYVRKVARLTRRKPKPKPGLPVETLRFVEGVEFLKVNCRKAGCSGTVEIKRGKVALVEKARYSGGADGKDRVKLRLTKAGKEALARSKRVRATGILTGKSGAKSKFIAILKR